MEGDKKKLKIKNPEKSHPTYEKRDVTIKYCSSFRTSNKMRNRRRAGRIANSLLVYCGWDGRGRRKTQRSTFNQRGVLVGNNFF